MAYAKGRGPYQAQGLGTVRRDWNVLKAVRRYRGQSAPTWTQYLTNTQKGRVKFSATKKR